MERLATALMAPVSIKRISLVLALLVAAPVATKFINGYLLCNFTLTMYYDDLAIGIAMLISCGIIHLLADAIKRDSTKTQGGRLRLVALVLIVTLLLAYAGCAICSFMFNLMAGGDSGRNAQITNQTKFDDVQLDQWQPMEQFVARKEHLCDDYESDHGIKKEFCIGMLKAGWSMIRASHRNDPLNLCANNNNETIKAIFYSDKATFQLTHRVDAVFKFAASIEWFVACGAAAAAILAILIVGSVETGNSAAGRATKNIP